MAFDTSDNLSQDGSQGGIGKLLAQALGINTTPTAAPIPGADSTGTLPGQYGYGQNGSLDSSSRLNDVMGKLNSGAGTRTERAAYGAALDGMIKKDPSLMSSSDLESAMQNAGTRTARAALGTAMAGQMIRGYNRGGKIKGPGTTTSDSIPGQVKETGEPILVSQGERILSAKQDMLLGQIAQMLGFKTVDELLASGTGEPVGPSIKGGTKAAAQGAGPDDWMRVHQAGDRTSIDYHPQAQAPKMDPADAQLVQNASANFNKVFSDADFQKPKAWYSGTDTRDERTGLEMERERRANAPADVLKNDPVKSALLYGVVGTGQSPQQFTAPATQPTQATQSSPQQHQVKPETPVQEGTTSPAPVTPGDALLGKQQAYTKANNLRSFEDVGGGIVRQVGADGRKMITNVGTGDITDSGKRFVDGNESAAIDRQNSTYNPAKQLETMQRLRLNSDLNNPEITDPSVIARAQLGLNALNAQSNTQGNAILHAAQADQANALTAQTKQMEMLRGKLLDPNTSQDERARLLQVVQAMSGHQAKTPEGKIAEETDEMGRKTSYWTDGNRSFQVSKHAQAAAKPAMTFDQYLQAARKDPKNKSFTDDQIREYYNKNYGGGK